MMTPTDDAHLRDAAARLPLQWHEANDGPFTGDDAASYRSLIEAAHVVADEARVTLHRWVDAGRRAGLSWADVGATVGTTKQAAQQRFGGGERDAVPAATEDGIVVRLGATAFNEVGMLEREGAAGRELIATGGLRLFFRQTDHAWQHLRTVGAMDPARMLSEGWTHVSTWFPFHYYKRAAG